MRTAAVDDAAVAGEMRRIVCGSCNLRNVI